MRISVQHNKKCLFGLSLRQVLLFRIVNRGHQLCMLRVIPNASVSWSIGCGNLKSEFGTASSRTRLKENGQNWVQETYVMCLQ